MEKRKKETQPCQKGPDETREIEGEKREERRGRSVK
jgi:hypothetical protein